MTRLAFGSNIIWKGEVWTLIGIPEVNRILIRSKESGHTELVDVNELQNTSSNTAHKTPSILTISKKEWEKAHEKFSALMPLIRKGKRQRTYDEIDSVAHHFGTSRVTIYRWLQKIDSDPRVSALIKNKREDFGKSRLSNEVDKIITDKINSFYLAKERPSVTELWEQVVLTCRTQKILPPSEGSVRRRVDRIQDRLVMAKRYSHKKAREMYEPLHGCFPNANVPLAVYQIDHTPADVIIVDDIYREPIGRPYLTIVSDTCTRMLAGFCFTLDPPGASSAGLAMAHAILPKKTWLAKFDIDADWPIYGIPHKIYADNAKEFRGTMLGRACQEYGILLENRPKGLPNYGGHIERLFRTFMKRVQSLPGSTFSNVQARGEYNSEKKAIFTLSELEQWFGIFVAKVYHHRRHKGLGDASPIKTYERFILGDNNTTSIGLPAPIKDERKLRLDFTPYSERTIQEYGVRFDRIDYYADVLRPWVHARDKNSVKLKRKFIFARDPRDISTIYFLDPETNQYFDIPYGDTTRPPMSVWELNAVTRRLREDPSLEINEELIFDGLTQMRQIQENAAEKSKVARRALQRRKNAHANIAKKQSEVKKIEYTTTECIDDLEAFDVEEAE